MGSVTLKSEDCEALLANLDQLLPHLPDDNSEWESRIPNIVAEAPSVGGLLMVKLIESEKTAIAKSAREAGMTELASRISAAPIVG
jgi:hypothetical protein